MPKAPNAVRSAVFLWLAAIAAGVFETAVFATDALTGPAGVSGGIAAGVAVRLVIYALLITIVLQLRRGAQWARIALTVLLSVLGTLSLVVGPIAWVLDDGNSLRAALARADTPALLFAASRVVHVLCVIGATVLMHRPTVNHWFRSTRRAVAPATPVA